MLVVIHTYFGEVLLLKRCDVPDFWQSVTGSLREQETPTQAAIREVQEETGLTVDHENLYDCQHQNRFEIKFPWKARYAPEVTHNIEYTFVFSLPAPSPIQLCPHEHSDYCWLPWEQAAQKVASYTNQEAILRWVKFRSPLVLVKLP